MKFYKEKSLAYFGKSFEKKVLNMIIGTKDYKGKKYIRDTKFGEKILQIIKQDHFEHNISKQILVYIKDFYTKNQSIPYYDSLEILVKSKVADELRREQVLEYMDDIRNTECENTTWIQENTLNFINTKNIYDAWHKIEFDIINRGKYEMYDSIGNLFQRAIVSQGNDNRLEAFTAGDYRDLLEGERHPIPTGIKALDKDMNGGLSLGELAIVVAGLKVGKSTLASFLANNAALEGYNVLQIFFEDTSAQIKMKHRAKMSAMDLSAVANKRNAESVGKKSDKELKKLDEKGCLVLHKMDSTETTVTDIEKVYRQGMQRGVWFPNTQEYKKIKFDLVLIDYVDCIKPKGKYRDDWGGDKEIIRDLEKLCSKKHGLNFACWTFTQGGRSSLNSNLVTSEDTGGSIKKLQVAHFIASIAKNLDQRSAGKATFAILGSRVGRDGIIYKDCIFDNAKMKISLKKQEKLSEFIREGTGESP